MTPLEDHTDRIFDTGGELITFTLDADVGLDEESVQGFAMAATDGHGRTMLVEMTLSGDRQGMTTVVTTYGADGEPIDPTLMLLGSQVMVTVDGAPNIC